MPDVGAGVIEAVSLGAQWMTVDLTGDAAG